MTPRGNDIHLPARRPAIFLDRDGVINRTIVINGVPHPPQSMAECELLSDVVEAMQLLQTLKMPLIVVTNQPDVARGAQLREEVERINDSLRQQLPIDAVYVCYHDNADNCDCRKPRPGMLVRAAEEHHLDLTRSFMVGDRSGDILAGAAVGCRTLLVDLPYSKGDKCKPTWWVGGLLEAAHLIKAAVSSDQVDGR